MYHKNQEIALIAGLVPRDTEHWHPDSSCRLWCRYQSIRQTLVHELTHNVWGEHDANFKALNSQLLREVLTLSLSWKALRSSGMTKAY